MLALGFSAGLPLLLVLGTLSFWLREAGIDHHHRHLSWVGLAYGFQSGSGRRWWTDALPLLTTTLGRRRGWRCCRSMGGGARWAWLDRPAPRRADAGALVVGGVRLRHARTSRWTPSIEIAPTRAPGALAATYQTATGWP